MPTSSANKIVSQISDGQIQAPGPSTSANVSSATATPSSATALVSSPTVWASVSTSNSSSAKSTLFIVSTTTAAPAVTTQVGNSTWGTLDNGCYPKWLPKPDGSSYDVAPWGNRTTKSHDAILSEDIQNTGVTRYYEFTISRGTIAPDGVLRDVILINGQFPAPAIEANWGDTLNITVHNEIFNPAEGTSLHWHGMLQKKTPWYDGVPAIGQCPIAPGHSFTYVFQAELYGTSWYHAHYSAQYTAGIVGPMVVYGPSQEDYDCDVGPVMLSDWYHIPYFSIVADAVGTDLAVIPPTSDNNLIQGRNNFNCSSKSYDNGTYYLGSHVNSTLGTYECQANASLSQFKFKAGKTHRLRLINYGADGVQKFRIDGISKMTVIAVDYVPVVPYDTDIVTLAVAQRTDVLVTAPSDKTASYWMRAEDVGGVTCGGSDNPLALAAIYNEDADTSELPTTSPAYYLNTTVCNVTDTWTTPEYAVSPSKPSFQQDLAITLDLNATGSFEWRLNNQTFRANFNSPILFSAAKGNVSYPNDPQWNVYNFDKNTSVIFNLTNNTPFVHPFHMHGHNFYVLDVGTGVWNGSVRNADNPMRRDTQVVPALGYAVFQMEADNPGVWPFHCHVAWHLSGGLAINIMSRLDDILPIPDVMPQTCVDWDYYTANNVVDQIDAGS
ncbi:hypothetical protein AAFC00_002057 [Neodothiora populina]|uniref:Multicopper oxidase n=1 Tax=Neodothiora populina TaxID=2781224 RepID=A0ABR3PG58_9PEZI